MLSRLTRWEPGIAKTLSVTLNQATKHRSRATFTSSHHTFSTIKEPPLNFEPHLNTVPEGCIFKPKKSTSCTASKDNPFHGICMDYDQLSAEMSMRFFAEDLFEANLAKKIKTNKEEILREFEKVKMARELNDPTSNIMCGSLKQNAYDVWQINTSTHDHRRLMFPTFKYLLSLCYHFPNFCFLTKHDIKDLYVSSIRDSIENYPYMPVEIFTLFGKSKIAGHAMMISDFDECSEKVHSCDKAKKDKLRELFLSITKYNMDRWYKTYTLDK